MMTEQQPLTTKEAAELLGMTPASVKNICRTGKIACTKVGDGVRAVYYLTMADVEAYKATTHKPGWVKGKPRKVREYEARKNT